MNEDLQDFFRKTTAMQAAIAPMTAWHKMFSSPATDLLQKNRYATTTMADMVGQMFKKPSFFDAEAVIKMHSQRNISRIILDNTKLLDSVGIIARNQKSISSMFSTSAFLQNRLIKSQIATPSFAAALNPSLLGYNTKVTALQSALKGLGSQMAVKGIALADEDFFERFQSTTNEALAITQELTQTEYVTTESIAKLEAFIGTSLEKLSVEVTQQIKASDKSPTALLNLWVGILGILFTIYTIIQPLLVNDKPEQNVVVKKEVEELKQFVGAKFEEALKSSAPAAVLRLDCNLRYNPSQKDSGFFRVRAGQEVHILDTKHKWVRITIIDTADNLPVMGWVMRKYLLRK